MHDQTVHTLESFFWATVYRYKKNRLMLLDPLSVLPVCLSVTLVYCGQTVGWIKMPLGMEVGIDPSDTVLDGDPAPPQKGTQQLPTFRALRPMTIVVKRSRVPATAEPLLWPPYGIRPCGFFFFFFLFFLA